MNSAILLLAAGAASLPACPPVEQLSKSAPISLKATRTLPKVLVERKVQLGKGDVFASSPLLSVDGVPTMFHVMRKDGRPGRTNLYVTCFAPWGEMGCAYREFTAKEGAPDIFVRQQGDAIRIMVRYIDAGRKRFEVYRLSQLTGLKKICG